MVSKKKIKRLYRPAKAINMVSVILTVFNREKIIKKVIESVINQTYQNFELLIIDDSSTDETLKIVSQFLNNKIKIFKTEKNSGGPALPRNIGIKKAKGSILCFLDSDDFWDKTYLYNITKIFKTNSNNLIVSTNAKLIVNGVVSEKKYFYFSNKHIQFSFKDNFYGNKVILSSLAISNNNICLFNEHESYQSLEDYFFVLQHLHNGFKHIFINKHLVLYNSESSDSIRLNKKHFNLYFLKFYFLIKNKIYFPIFYVKIGFDLFKHFLRFKLSK
jgi:teichuronic acid biosynthesis glycosyltransferase TuaG